MNSKVTHIGAVMNRQYITDDEYIYFYRNIVLGTYDEKNSLFIDEYGNEYYDLLAQQEELTDVPVAISNVMTIDEIREQAKDLPLDAIIFDYQTQVQQQIYCCLGYTNNFMPIVVSLNLENIRQHVNKVAKQDEKEQDEELVISNMDQVEKLILDVVEGQDYTKEQLEEMIVKLGLAQDIIENAIGTIETKIGAMEANKPFREYVEEKAAVVEDTPRSTRVITTKEDKPDTSKLKEELQKKYKIPKKEEIKINPPKKEPRMDIDGIFKEVTKVLIAQDDPAYRFITELARKELHPLKKREGILITGQSGSGKTLLMELTAKYMDRPFYHVDSTQLTSPGYVGEDIEQVLWDLYVKCGKDKEKTERAIIYFDEIDKKGSEKNDDVNAKGVLNLLLKFIEGSTYKAQADTKGVSQIVPINTANMTIIFGGAFEDVYKSLILDNKIGFDTEKSTKDAPKYREAETKDFVEVGKMTKEFMGRVTVIKLNDLTQDDLKRILREGDKSATRIQEEIFRKIGVKIRFTDGYIDKVAEKAFKKKTGARGLNGIVDESTWRAFTEVYQNEDVYSELILTEESVDDSTKYKLVKAKKRSK